MGYVSVSSVNLSTNKNNIGTNSAVISYAASGVRTQVSPSSQSYSEWLESIEYRWNNGDSGASGSHTYSISSGQKNTITISVTVVATFGYQEYEYVELSPEVPPAEDGSGGSPAVWGWVPGARGSYPDSDSASASIDVYAKPEKFDWGISTGEIICSSGGLSAAKTRGFATHVGQYKSWDTQSDKYGQYDYLAAKSGDVITASWYNSCANAVGVSNVTGGANGSLITAERFDALADAVS